MAQRRLPGETNMNDVTNMKKMIAAMEAIEQINESDEIWSNEFGFRLFNDNDNNSVVIKAGNDLIEMNSNDFAEMVAAYQAQDSVN